VVADIAGQDRIEAERQLEAGAAGRGEDQ